MLTPKQRKERQAARAVFQRDWIRRDRARKRIARLIEKLAQAWAQLAAIEEEATKKKKPAP